MQLDEFESPDSIFSEYAYFSSYSSTWLAHARAYADMAMQRFGLDKKNQVVEIASNDGYLLQYFAAKGIPVLGIEPAANVAEAAREKGIPTLVQFFGAEMARALAVNKMKADLVVGNNVLAHVPNVNDFIQGIKILLHPHGVATLEFPHLLKLMAENQFDTIYHEHFSYFSLTTVKTIFAAQGLTVFDVEELSTHGGSLRLYVRHRDHASLPVSSRVAEVLAKERAAGLTCLEPYLSFAEKAEAIKHELLGFVISAKQAGKSIASYGAPAKGNTLLNYCGVGCDFIDYTVDLNPHKQGHFLPGTHIPIYHPDYIRKTTPDYVLILPWNLKDEITAQLSYIRQWGGRFVVPIPTVEVY